MKQLLFKSVQKQTNLNELKSEHKFTVLNREALKKIKGGEGDPQEEKKRLPPPTPGN